MFQDWQENSIREYPKPLHASHTSYVQSKCTKEARLRSSNKDLQNYEGFHELLEDVGEEDAGGEDGLGLGIRARAWG